MEADRKMGLAEFRRMDKKRTVVIAATAALSLLALICGYVGYPLNGTNDAIFFMPPSINFATHHELTNPITKNFTDPSDPSGQKRMLFYPPLFPMAVSLFIAPQSPLSYPRQAFFALGFMNMLALVLTSRILYKVATAHDKKLSWPAVLIICLALIITLRISWGSGCRPETLARLFIITGFLAMLFAADHKTGASAPGATKKPRLIIGILALLLGLTAATHPGGTLLFVAAIGIFFSLEEKWRGAFRDTALTYAFGGLAFVLVIQLSPFNVFEVISGTAANANTHTQALTGIWSGTHLMQVIASNFSSPYKILLFLVMLVVLAFGIKVYREHRDKIKSPILFVCFCIAFIGLLGYFVTESRNGYVTLFSTPVLAALLYSVIHISKMKIAQYGVAAVLLFLAITAAQPIILFPSFIKNGVGIDEARNAFEKIVSTHPADRYLFTFHMWVVSENYNAMDVLHFLKPGDKIPPRSIIVWGQHQDGMGPDDSDELIAPPEVRGCPLIASNFVTEVPEIFGIRLADATPSYAFAAYACQ